MKDAIQIKLDLIDEPVNNNTNNAIILNWMSCHWQSCWCGSWKLWAPWGTDEWWALWCVIIMRPLKAPMGVLPQRHHSPWWANSGTITSYQPVVNVMILMCQHVNCVNLHFFLCMLTFKPPVFYYLVHFVFLITSVVSRWKCHVAQTWSNSVAAVWNMAHPGGGGDISQI